MWGFKTRRTFASANEEQTTSQRWSGLNALNSKVLWHDSIDRNCSTRENKYEPSFWKEKRNSASQILYTVLYIQNRIIRKNEKDIFTRLLGAKAEPSLLELCWATTESRRVSKILYNEEFDPGSGWTLATGLTHASRGAAWSQLADFDGDRRTGA